MKGIDIYHGESKSGTTLKTIPEKAYKESDFVIVKATQGTSYKYASFFAPMIKRVLKDGKLGGAYHYAGGGDAKAEADYFISVVKPYIGKIILCLDWEGMQNSKFGSKTWCKTFIDRVKAKTGVRCVLYTGSDGCTQNVKLAGEVPLWFAGYPKPQATGWTTPKFKYNLGSWGFCDIWQYTSSNEIVDRNITGVTKKEWQSWASSTSPSPERHIELLEVYNQYIKKYPNKFINKYDNSLISFHDAKAKVEKGKSAGITCVVPTRWALYDMGIEGKNGKSLISTEKGTFKDWYVGDVKNYFTRITKGDPIGMTVKNAVDKGFLKKGDIICYKDLTHISVYSGTAYTVYEGGGACTVDGHYPDGITKSYKNSERKISEILRWKTKENTKKSPEISTVEKMEQNSAIKKTPEILLTQARSWLGYTEKDGSHKVIINLYNAYKPLARGYKVKYTDSWCATFVSACAIACNYVDIIPLECSCYYMIELAKEKGIWNENDDRTPDPGDIILYDWQDSGKGDCKGTPDHIGIVEKVSAGKITVIEGNYNDSVKRRIISVGSKGIRGYIIPKYNNLSTKKEKAETVTTTKTVKKSGYSGTFPTNHARGFYRRGDIGKQVKYIQKFLNWAIAAGLEVDGVYGTKTLLAVKNFQNKAKIKADGLFGKDTLKAARNYKK